MDKFSISAIVRTKNGGDTLQLCLDKLNRQTVQCSEIIVVDSGSTDNTLDIAKQYNCKIIYYPKDEEFNYSKALNIGITEAKGSYILVISMHVIAENKKMVEFMVKFLQKNESISAVSSYLRKHHKPQVSQWKDVDWSICSLHNFNGIAMYNPCSMFPRKHWEEYPFDESLPGAEDQDWAYYFMRKHNLGTGILHNPYALYLNKKITTYRACRDILILGRHVYPPVLGSRYILSLLTIKSVSALLNFNFYKIYTNYILAFYLIRENLGFKMDFKSSYYKE